MWWGWKARHESETWRWKLLNFLFNSNFWNANITRDVSASWCYVLSNQQIFRKCIFFHYWQNVCAAGWNNFMGRIFPNGNNCWKLIAYCSGRFTLGTFRPFFRYAEHHFRLALAQFELFFNCFVICEEWNSLDVDEARLYTCLMPRCFEWSPMPSGRSTITSGFWGTQPFRARGFDAFGGWATLSRSEGWGPSRNKRLLHL